MARVYVSPAPGYGERKEVAMELPVAKRVAHTSTRIRLSDEERQRRSDQAKRLLAEGKLGKNDRGGQPSKLRSNLAVRCSNEIAKLDVAELTLLDGLLRRVREMSEAEIVIFARLFDEVLGAIRSTGADPYARKDPEGMTGQ
jgi:hypothetical protein